MTSLTHPPVPSRRPVPPAPRARRLAVVGVVAALLGSSTVWAALLPVPYLSLRPGSVRPVTEQVLVDGVDTHRPEQSIAYTTVSVSEATLLAALIGWLDDDVDVVPDELIRGDRDPDENRRYNAQLMDDSKRLAVAVALTHLGHEVEVRTTGTVVRQILPDSPAAEVLELDDIIVAVNGEPVDGPDMVGELLQPGGPGARHRLTVERPAGSGTTIEVDVTTVASPEDPARAIIGIAVEDRIVGVDLPFDVVIDSGTVGGPSAGLAFTLAVIDVLTPGELTGGHLVAATGTIRLDGTVGPVGGASQKAVSVREAGYDVFLVPALEVDEVRATVGDGLTVIGVGTLAEALEALGALGGDAGSLAGVAVDGS